MGRNPLVSSLLSAIPVYLLKIPAIPASFPPHLTPAVSIFFHSFFWGGGGCFCFFGPPIIVSGSHVWAVRCARCPVSASALMGISNILHAVLHMEIDKSRCNGTVMRYQSSNLLQVRGAVIPLFGGKTAGMEGLLRR